MLPYFVFQNRIRFSFLLLMEAYIAKLEFNIFKIIISIFCFYTLTLFIFFEEELAYIFQKMVHTFRKLTYTIILGHKILKKRRVLCFNLF